MITVHYTCKKCGVKERAVQMPARATADSKVIDYIQQIVGGAVRDDHQRASPKCRASIISEVKISTPKGSQFIGQQVE